MLALENYFRYSSDMDERNPASTESADPLGIRTRIIEAAAVLIAAGGRDAATTRAVAHAADVAAPTIYRIFGDKRGLLDAVAEDGLARYVAEKSKRTPHADPLRDLRDGWDLHVAFGLSHPELFVIMSGDPHQHDVSPAAAAGLAVLRRLVGRIARSGRLKVSEKRAVALIHSVCVGTILTLLTDPEERRDPGLSEAAREAVLATITGEPILPEDSGPREAATALRASLDRATSLSSGERHLLEELLDRIADGDRSST